MRPVLTFTLLFALLMWAGGRVFDHWVETTELPVLLSDTSVEVRDRSGQLLRAFPVGDGLVRLAVHSDQVDPDLIAMLLRYEDKRFYTHSGVDPLALVRAAGQAIWHGQTVSGGSTLTMQVARLIEDGPTGRWQGKLRQIRLALALEQRLSKQEILTLYLTHAPYGGRVEGVRAASLTWFGREPANLTPAQAALLVALPQSPERRRPDRNPDAAEKARARVLDRLTQQGVLSPEDQAAALREPLPDARIAFPRLAPHLADQLRAAHPETGRFDLTLDARLQKQLRQILGAAVRDGAPKLSAAVVVADHQSGEILASVGSPGYADASRLGFVDMTRASRSPGSTLKPLIYGLAFDQGLAHPETLIRDGPVDFDGYAPRNFDGEFRGDLRVREALQLSLNIPVVRLTNELGPARVMAALRRSGAAPDLPGGAPGLAIALGGIGVTLTELVQLYAGIAAGGQGPVLRVRQTAPRQVQDRLMSDVAAWHLGDILRDLVPPSGGRGGDLAWKTGTSYGHRDTWAIGWDGQHVVGVWMGRADGTPVPGAFGAELAAPVLFEAFARVKPEPAPLPPPPPATLISGIAELPLPLQRFRSRTASFDPEAGAPELVFPPEGARLAAGTETVMVRIRGGEVPFLLLADGVPVMTRQYQREFDIPATGPGFSSLVIVDGKGRSDRVQIELQ